MSRSYKKHPGFKDSDNGKKWVKRQANKRVRKYKKRIPDGCTYKVLYQQWDICDNNWRYYSRDEAKRNCWPYLKDEMYKLWMK